MTNRFILAVIILQFLTVGCRTQSRGAVADLSPFRPIHLSLAANPTMPAIADVNKGGNLDIMVPNGGGVSVFLGDGKGGFAQADGSPFASGQTGADIAVGDFNGDGSLDIALANHGVKTAEILLGNGKAQFLL